ncbi:SCO family protein [Paracoccaceae bacterium]|nr:SCO family protein [Paracoccaceae bacterium]
MLRYSVAAATTACVALIAGVWYTSLGPVSADHFASCRTSSIAGGTSQIGGPLTLMASNGQTVTSEEVFTKPSLIYFGYTFCPDICPLDALRNVDAVDVLESQGHLVTPVFISIDPRRDTPQVVGEFAENMHERMIGLTGTPEQVKAASKTYKTYFKAHAAEDDYYLVDHSTFSYLVLPEHGFVEFFRRDLPAEAVADRISCFVDNA